MAQRTKELTYVSVAGATKINIKNLKTLNVKASIT